MVSDSKATQKWLTRIAVCVAGAVLALFLRPPDVQAQGPGSCSSMGWPNDSCASKGTTQTCGSCLDAWGLPVTMYKVGKK